MKISKASFKARKFEKGIFADHDVFSHFNVSIGRHKYLLSEVLYLGAVLLSVFLEVCELHTDQRTIRITSGEFR